MDLSFSHSPEPQPYSEHGFRVPRPDGEIGGKIWDAAETYGKDSKAVAAALFHAVVALESQLAALRADIAPNPLRD
ncbi:hypothetical protein QYN14_09975 [Rhodococcus ruber]|uniref:hypothetical protein n=1 Tax=Rhodococcus ruber TaxID=1830 RepID=UPI00265A3A53|nr:hypothetical protein [Rhodococcus ruber]WKK13865.1 hypothetical protein QYN14_09975 [Rhodococcus ruber]